MAISGDLHSALARVVTARRSSGEDSVAVSSLGSLYRRFYWDFLSLVPREFISMLENIAGRGGTLNTM